VICPSLLHSFHYDLCVNLVKQVYASLVNHSIYNLPYLPIVLSLAVIRTTYSSSSFRVSLKLLRESKGLAYKNAENRYPWGTMRRGATTFLKLGVQFLLLGRVLLPFYRKIRQVSPVWCSRLHNHTLFIKKLCKKLGSQSKF